jgi:hypothetical protein
MTQARNSGSSGRLVGSQPSRVRPDLDWLDLDWPDLDWPDLDWPDLDWPGLG